MVGRFDLIRFKGDNVDFVVGDIEQDDLMIVDHSKFRNWLLHLALPEGVSLTIEMSETLVIFFKLAA